MKPLTSSELQRFRLMAARFKADKELKLAEDSYTTLLDLEASIFGTESSAVALCLYNLAEIKFDQHQPDHARGLLQHAVAIWEQVHPNDYLSLLSYTEAAEIVSAEHKHMAFRASKTRTAA